MSKKNDSDTLSAGIPILMLPVFLIMLVIRYPVLLIAVVPIALLMFFSTPHTTPAQPTPPAAVQLQPATVPSAPPPPPPPPPREAAPAAPSSAAAARYRIQVGAFESEARAVTFAKELERLFSDVSMEPVVGQKTLYRVLVGRFPDERSAQEVMDRLRREGLSPVMARVD
jgi:cell division septation protein DedD